MSRVGIVGTGDMGRPVVDRLLAAGHEVAAYVRRPEARAELGAAGVEVVADLPALGRDRDVVLVYVYSDEQAREVTLDSGLLDALAPETLVVVHTTGSPATVEAIAARHPAVVDAAASGGPAQIADGTLTVFLGGEEEHVARFRPVLEAYAGNAVHFGPLGSGQRVKLLNNLLFGAHVQLALEAARVAESFGLDVVQVARTLHTGSGASFALDLVAMVGSAEGVLQGAGPYIRKDVAVAREVAAGLGVPLGTIEEATRPLLQS
ncbi:NAD(P)-dependent oxidoreductase [Blastococcus sp. TF02A-26]|uniref:NAD(P)-dependent oxidoreductase n=1 Tax=Blastococcus sp. TF02A-26 TaxID=2250577 RepID=UPI000DEB6A9B|nr:NAD(P)-dependent oxidoreductase [Blastococcus sp. TF02A-26]RBY84336.1 NAD(P)-dependent oxidoreductase [Blastococcus sp. TF02A-26]